jgi:DedD protein
MEKEQKKLLLVVVSVGVFLVVIVGAAILILTPAKATGGAAFSSSTPIPAGLPQPSNVDPAQMVQNPESIQGIQPAPVIEIVDAENPAPAIDVDKKDENSVTIKIPTPSTAVAVPKVSENPAPVASNQVVVTKPAPAAVEKPAPAAKPAPVTQPAPAAKPAAATPKPAAAPKSAVASTAKTKNDFWVQTGAFSAMVRAEGAKDTLASKGITSIIENRQVDGKTWYRVRLGPYTSENEANYWLALVQAIDGFTESQVRQTVSVR